MKARILVIVSLLAVCANADIIRPFAQATTNQVWWQVKKGRERVEFIDHTGRTNFAYRTIGSTENFKWSNNNTVATIAPDLSVLEYTIRHGRYDYTLDMIAPATYDLVNGKWYTELTDAEKEALWKAYIDRVIAERKAWEAERYAPAKFDVSRTPEEYQEYLLGGRDLEDVTPAEARQIAHEVAVYKREWQRIHDPEAYDGPKIHIGSTMSEQEKIRMHSRATLVKRKKLK